MNEILTQTTIAPLVSIICTAYNHELYIKKALDGFVMQKTNFPFEIIISDDASTDSTASIIKQYEKQFPELFKTFYHNENQYSKGIPFFYEELIANSQCKYIAICEGDDYWIDPYKLQKQIDFMEANKEYVLCYGRAKVFDQQMNRFLYLIGYKSVTTEELLNASYIPTLTVCLKRTLLNDYIKENSNLLKDLLMGDYPLVLWYSMQGKIHYFTDIFAVYRKLSTSASHFTDPNKWFDFGKSTHFVKTHFIKKYYVNLEEQKIALQEADKNYIRQQYSTCLIYGVSGNKLKKYRIAYRELKIANKCSLLGFASSNLLNEKLVIISYKVKSILVCKVKRIIKYATNI